MRIIVDADATPSLNLIENVAKKYNLDCVFICDDTHRIVSNYSKILTVSKGFQSVDMYLLNYIKDNDIVVTQDYGVATIALLKNCYVTHPKGYMFNQDNIDKLLMERHISSKLRRKNKHYGHIKARCKDYDERLVDILEKIIIDELK